MEYALQSDATAGQTSHGGTCEQSLGVKWPVVFVRTRTSIHPIHVGKCVGDPIQSGGGATSAWAILTSNMMRNIAQIRDNTVEQSKSGPLSSGDSGTAVQNLILIGTLLNGISGLPQARGQESRDEEEP